MKQSSLFAYASASVQGSKHYARGMNNQDAFHVTSTDTLSLGIVADGCSRSGIYSSHTEVGAHMGSALLAACIRQHEHLFDTLDSKAWLDIVYRSLIEKVQQILWISKSDIQWIVNHWEFSILGYVISPTKTVIFGCGDGIYSLNGTRKTIGPFANNEPPYLLFSLFKSPPESIDPSLLTFTLHEELPTAELQELWVGTDGVEYLYDMTKLKSDNLHYPFITIENLMNDQKVFEKQPNDEYNLYPTRVLEKFTKEKMKIDYQKQDTKKSGGILHDDTTVILVKRN